MAAAGKELAHRCARCPSTPSRRAPPGLRGRLFAGDVDLVIAAAGILTRSRSWIVTSRAPRCWSRPTSPATSPVARDRRPDACPGPGTIVVLSSIAAIRPRKANFVYGAAKSGLDAFGRGLADSLHGTGVHVLLVRPGFVTGRMTAGWIRRRWPRRRRGWATPSRPHCAAGGRRYGSPRRWAASPWPSGSSRGEPGVVFLCYPGGTIPPDPPALGGAPPNPRGRTRRGNSPGRPPR